jgi:hypothetical protein
MTRFCCAVLVVAASAVAQADDPTVAALQERIRALMDKDTPSVAIVNTPTVTAPPKVVKDGCPCGEACQCTDCQCGTAKAKAKRTRPDLIVTVWDEGCPHGENWLRQVLPKLKTSSGPWVLGKHIAIRRVSSEEGIPCPTFDYHGIVWSGFTTVDAFRTELTKAMKGEEPEVAPTLSGLEAPAKTVKTTSVVVTQAPAVVQPQVVMQPQRVMRQDYHTHRCSSCGHIWSHHDSGGNHHCPACGRGPQYTIYNQVGWVEQPAYRTVQQPTYRTVRRASPCPLGGCP